MRQGGTVEGFLVSAVLKDTRKESGKRSRVSASAIPVTGVTEHSHNIIVVKRLRKRIITGWQT